jgi:hypothetical protein
VACGAAVLVVAPKQEVLRGNLEQQHCWVTAAPGLQHTCFNYMQWWRGTAPLHPHMSDK